MSVFSRRGFLGKVALGTGSGITLAATAFFYGTRLEVEMLRLERVRIPIPRLPERLSGLRIVYMSDFHLFPHTRIELIEEAVRRVDQLQPDLVALGGDYVLRTADSIFDLAPALARLNPRLGIFAVLGNHDHWQGAETVVSGLRRSGIEVLRNQGRLLNIDGESLFLAGADDAWVQKTDLPAALEAHPGQVPTILLMHEPDLADQVARDPRIHLQLSGHSHGGQVRIPFYGSPFLPPYGRKYDMGHYRVGNLELYTSVGIGVTAPIRLNCPPEITEVTLLSADT